MKNIAIAVSVAVLVFAVAVWAQIPAQTETGSVEQELIKLEKELADAWVKRDVAFFDRVIADDFTWTAPYGIVSTKAQSLATLKSGEDVVTS